MLRVPGDSGRHRVSPGVPLIAAAERHRQERPERERHLLPDRPLPRLALPGLARLGPTPRSETSS